MKDNIDVFKN